MKRIHAQSAAQVLRFSYFFCWHRHTGFLLLLERTLEHGKPLEWSGGEWWPDRASSGTHNQHVGENHQAATRAGYS
jgi:hypothetical protein